MAEVVLDANVIVALLYASDAQHQRAQALVDRLEREQHTVVLVDFLIFEALSVLCRRATERKTSPPDLQAAIALIRSWFDGGEVRFLARESERLAGDVLDVIAESGGALNANDALLVVLEREGAIENFASFDSGFDNVEGFRRIS
ncbi:MAG TPA: type II toxin-antitoxin system VapC family toxin [Polyangiaceae bacterium]|jgi:predicted nucleic acid-binding protein|nr:type II toxin-antitoxin system VapC family toxin [Polyangiaceae bacterium]